MAKPAGRIGRDSGQGIGLDRALAQATEMAKAGALNHAVEAFHSITQRYGPRADVFTNLGLTLSNLGRTDEAIHALRNALHLNPRQLEARLNLGLVLLSQRRFEEAGQSFMEALQQEPEHPGGHDGLGLVAHQQGYLLRAQSHYRRALACDPGHIQSLVNLASVLQESGELSQSLSLLEQLTELPHGEPYRSNYLMGLQYSDRHSADSLFEAASRIGQQVEPPPCQPWRAGQARSGPPKRIGLVSADLRAHPVGWFLKSLLPELKRHYSLYAYANQTQNDHVSQELMACFTQWKPIAGMSDDQVLQVIRADELDVLLDLSGHTAGHRLAVFAARAAPIQASWLGYFATTGVRNMDYILMDSEHAPLESTHLFSEQVAWIEPIRMCFSPPVYAPEVGPPPSLANGIVTFGCFNNSSKITDTAVALWAQTLLAVPDSRLYLKWKSLIEPGLKKSLRDRFKAQGVSPSRLVFFGASSHQAMLEEYGEIDIALDPFPFSGGTTTCEALWMGVPVVTLRGDRPVARQTSAMLRALDLSDFSASDPADFARICRELARDTARRVDLRNTLRQRMQQSPLLDARQFVQAFTACINGLQAPPP
jgi:predicted O-linked N-acetylglucosamine transferase (SPINDLY family)